MKVLLVDAFDSFVYIIKHYYSTLGVDARVVRVDEEPLETYQKWRPDLLVLGPGPGTPKEHGYPDLLKSIDNFQPVFGVCLGYQAIGEYFGWRLEHAPSVQHGKFSNIHHDGYGVFSGLPNPMRVVRYHSLVLQCNDCSHELNVSAYDTTENNIMALRHTNKPIEGVQFHPESIGTERGLEIIRNSLKLVSKSRTPNCSVSAEYTHH